MTNQFFTQENSHHILVIGDVMVDSYIKGQVSRISPEAPVPILDVTLREFRLGGAANVALNLKKLGCKVTLCAIIGNDAHGDDLLQLMHKEKLDTQGILRSSERRTTIKHRIIGNRNQMLRIDEEDNFLLTENENEQFIASLSKIINEEKIAAIIFEDYDKGLLSEKTISTIIKMAEEKEIITATDPKKRNFFHYAGVTLFKPNLKEFCDANNLKIEPFSLPQLQQQAAQFAEEQRFQFLLITLSDKGLLLYSRSTQKFIHIPAQLIKVSDVSGAGDTVISVATLCLLHQLDDQALAYIANLAGSIVCQYPGVVPIDMQLLQQELEKSKFFTIKEQ